MPTGPSDIRRIEAGILNYGVDMTLETNPYEIGLERLVNLNKPEPFIGRDALKRISSDGVRRKLVGVEIDGANLDLNMTKWPVRAAETRGTGRQTVYSPRSKRIRLRHGPSSTRRRDSLGRTPDGGAGLSS